MEAEKNTYPTNKTCLLPDPAQEKARIGYRVCNKPENERPTGIHCTAGWDPLRRACEIGRGFPFPVVDEQREGPWQSLEELEWTIRL